MSKLLRVGLWLLDLLLLVIAAILLYLIIWDQGGVRLSHQLLTLKSTQQQQLDKLYEDNHQLLFKHKMLHGDDEYLDWEARSHWELVKPGEEVIWYHQLEDENAMDKY